MPYTAKIDFSCVCCGTAGQYSLLVDNRKGEEKEKKEVVVGGCCLPSLAKYADVFRVETTPEGVVNLLSLWQYSVCAWGEDHAQIHTYGYGSSRKGAVARDAAVKFATATRTIREKLGLPTPSVCVQRGGHKEGERKPSTTRNGYYDCICGECGIVLQTVHGNFGERWQSERED